MLRTQQPILYTSHLRTTVRTIPAVHVLKSRRRRHLRRVQPVYKRPTYTP